MADEWIFDDAGDTADDAFLSDYDDDYDSEDYGPDYDSGYDSDYESALDDTPEYDDFSLDEILSEYGGGSLRRRAYEPPVSQDKPQQDKASAATSVSEDETAARSVSRHAGNRSETPESAPEDENTFDDTYEYEEEEESGEPDDEGYEAEDDEDEGSYTSRQRRASFSAAPQEKPGFAERFLTPIIRLVATRLAKRQLQNAEAANWPDPVDIRETPELPPRKAAKFYAQLAMNNRFRCRVATFLCIVLIWISLKLPMAGMLGKSLALQSGVCLVLTLAVMMAALDVIAAGLRQLADLRPGMETLAAMAAILSCIDAAAVLSGHGENLPFCAVGAVALTSALWGQRLSCSALNRTLKTVADAKTPSVLTSESDDGKGPKSLMRSARPSMEGFVRRSEEQNFCQTVYATASPILLGCALLLSILACLGGNFKNFLHTFSALVAVSASFAAFFSFSLPYALAARKLRSAGAAIAGFAGCAEIGKTRRIVIGDTDLFPPGTMEFKEINVLDGTPVKQVVTFTASLISASGSGAAALFTELVEARKYSVPQVYEFKCHEGGGLSGLVDGQRVLVGPAGYMNLMGIRLPHDIQSRNAICTAISNELVGVFVINYKPVSSVQNALETLMRGRTHATFATRDFNITPLMIKKLFRMSTDHFNFPSFRDRYRMAAAAAREDAPMDAVITRTGMLPFAEVAEAGRKLYKACRINTVLSVAGAVIGLAILFLLCRTASFDTATAGKVLTFMLLWALPEVILSIGQNR